MKENVTIEQMIALIMCFKKDLGEFSVDMYYDDLPSDCNKRYVVKFKPLGDKPTHYRCGNFSEGLNRLYNRLADKVFK